MSGYGDRDNSEYVEGNRGDANYIDSNPTRGENAGNTGSSGGMMNKIKGAMGMGKSDKDSSDYDTSRSGDYVDTRDKYSSGDNYDSSNLSSEAHRSAERTSGGNTSGTYGSTGRDTSDTFGSTGRDTSDTYGSSRRDNTDTYGSTGRDTYGSGVTGTTGTTGLGSDSYGSSGNTTGQFGVGNNTSSFTDAPIGSTKGGDAFANKAYDGQRTIDDFTSGTTGTGASNLTSRTGDDNYGQRDTYGSGRDNTTSSDTYGSTGRGATDTYGSSGLGSSDTYGSSRRDDTDSYGSSRRDDDYETGKHHHGEKKEGMMDKMKDKMGMRTNADAYDEDRNVRDVDSRNY